MTIVGISVPTVVLRYVRSVQAEWNRVSRQRIRSVRKVSAVPTEAGASSGSARMPLRGGVHPQSGRPGYCARAHTSLTWETLSIGYAK